MSNIEKNFAGCSRDLFHRNYEDNEPFCTDENWQSSVIFLNQEIELLGLPSICSNDNGGQSQLDVISLVNVSWALIQSSREKSKKLSELETQVRKLHSDIEHMQSNTQRLRDLIEYKERQAADAFSKEKQANLMNSQLQNDMKMSKDEIKKLSSMVLHRESRFNHEAKKKDQEIAKLKERLLKVITEAKQGFNSPMTIEITGDLAGKPEGAMRGRWRNDTEDLKRGDELLQKAIDAYQDRQDSLTQEVTNSQQIIAMMLNEVSDRIGLDPNDNMGVTELPSNLEAFRLKWQTMLKQFNVDPTKPSEEIEPKISDLFTDHFTLHGFVPLSDVKHTAPPGWVSRGHCTLPPTGKGEPVKLRSSVSDTRPRPRSSHLSPYRGQQAPQSQNQVMYRSVMNSTRSGSMSPTSASPTRWGKGDTRSLPRMTGTKLSLRRPSQQSQTSSANNSSADESSVSAYRKIVGRKSYTRPSTSRALSPGALSPGTLSPAESETESSSELAQQLKKLGRYLEKKQSRNDPVGDVNDPQMDEHLGNIRKALAKSNK